MPRLPQLQRVIKTPCLNVTVGPHVREDVPLTFNVPAGVHDERVSACAARARLEPVRVASGDLAGRR